MDKAITRLVLVSIKKLQKMKNSKEGCGVKPQLIGDWRHRRAGHYLDGSFERTLDCGKSGAPSGESSMPA